jgi:hypothetical protein
MSESASNTDIVKRFEESDQEARSEHVSLDSGGTPRSQAEVTAAVEFQKPSEVFRFANRMHGTRFLFELYDEGYLKIRQWKKNALKEEFYLTLRYLDPVARVTRVVARRCMYFAAAFFSAGLVTAVIDAILPYDQIFRSATILLGCGSAISFMLFLYWSHERTHFHSATGDCEVLTLMGSVESFRSCRVLAPKISKAIEAAQSDNVKDYNVYLREEMHEHYRLQRAGAISGEACSAATKTILSKFD